jgi:diadenosine tetraphosphate (Ap4A) HIT family hydrolase
MRRQIAGHVVDYLREHGSSPPATTGVSALALNTNIDNCPLCHAVNNRALFKDDVNVNTILGRRDDFIIVPALGPLVVGHVLIVTTTHTAGLRYLQAETQRNYEQLSTQLREYCARFDDTVLEAEHGANDYAIRGPCIRHTHIHILPGLGNEAEMFDKRRDLEEVDSSNYNRIDSYLWINNGHRAKVYDASRVIGQEIRQTVGQYLAIDDWDWAVNPKTELIALTIEYWNGIDEWLT